MSFNKKGSNNNKQNNSDKEVAITHGSQYGEEYYTFVNGQHTTSGGTHLSAFRESIVKTLRDYFKKDFDSSDVRASIVAALSVRIQNPIFESQTKTKLGSTEMKPDGTTVRVFVNDFVKNALDDFLHTNKSTADLLHAKMVADHIGSKHHEIIVTKDQMLRKIEEVIYSDTKKLILKKNGTERVKKFTWEKCAEDTLKIYQKII